MDLKNASILLVEDEPLLREIMGEWLGRIAGQVFCAEDGAAALNILASNKIDLLISDVRMPTMDGIALLKQIKQSPEPKPRVILVTGFSDLPLREAHDMGAEAILEKPITREDLLHAAQRSLTEPEELWRQAPGPAETKLNASFASLASALEEKRIAFGRRGFSIALNGGLHSGPVQFTLDFKADQRIVSGQGVVRWTAPHEKQAGIEITHLDDDSRAWLIELVKQHKPAAFIPRSTGAEATSSGIIRDIA